MEEGKKSMKLVMKMYKQGFWCFDYNATRQGNTKHSKPRKEQQVILYTDLRWRRYIHGKDQDGYVLESTKVFLDHWPGNYQLSTHPMFDVLPKHTLFTFDPNLLQELHILTMELKDSCDRNPNQCE